MAALEVEHTSPPFSSPTAHIGPPSTSPGPLHVSDLDPLTPSSQSRPHRLEPLQHDPAERRRRSTKKKRKTRKGREGGEEGRRLEASGRGEEGSTLETNSQPDPLLGTSTLQQLQARLDPLYRAAPPSQNVDLPSTTSISQTTGRGADERAPENSEVVREEGESVWSGSMDTLDGTGSQRELETRRGGRQKGGRRKRTRSRRSQRERGLEQTEDEEGGGGAEMGAVESIQQKGFMGVETDSRLTVSSGREDMTPQPQTGRELPDLPPDTASSDHTQVNQDAQRHYPPPEEIHEEQDGEEGAMEGAPPPHDLPLTNPQFNHPSDVIFVERRDGHGFVVQRKGKGGGERDMEEGEGGLRRGAGVMEISSADFALYSHKFVQRVALAAHGLLAGLSLWDCVVSNVLGNQTDRHLTLVQYYHPLTLPAHSLYLLLLSLVCLSLLDRIDPARLDKHCLRFTFQSPSGIVVLLVTLLSLVALVVTVSIAAIDERISLYPEQPSLWPDLVSPLNLTTLPSTNSPPPPTTHPSQDDTVVYVPTDDPVTSTLRLWLALSIFRSICCVLGWGMAVWVSEYDRMNDYLSDMAESCDSVPPPASNSTTTSTAAQENLT